MVISDQEACHKYERGGDQHEQHVEHVDVLLVFRGSSLPCSGWQRADPRHWHWHLLSKIYLDLSRKSLKAMDLWDVELCCCHLLQGCWNESVTHCSELMCLWWALWAGRNIWNGEIRGKWRHSSLLWWCDQPGPGCLGMVGLPCTVQTSTNQAPCQWRTWVLATCSQWWSGTSRLFVNHHRSPKLKSTLNLLLMIHLSPSHVSSSQELISIPKYCLFNEHEMSDN